MPSLLSSTGIVLVIFLALLPGVLYAMARWTGIATDSALDFEIVKRFFIFQIFATFIYQAWSETLFVFASIRR